MPVPAKDPLSNPCLKLVFEFQIPVLNLSFKFESEIYVLNLRFDFCLSHSLFESQSHLVNLRFTFESQIHRGFVFEKPISDQSEIRVGFADCPRQTFASAGCLRLSTLV